MGTFVSDIGILFGLVEESKMPTLPPGFAVLLEKDEWAIAIAPDGRRYYIGKDKLTLESIATNEDEARTHGRLKAGVRFFDSRTQIHLSKPIQ